MIKRFLLRLINPPRVFIALMIMVILWLLPAYIKSEKQKTAGLFIESAEASNRYTCDSRVCGQCCNHGSCVKCPEGDEDPPPPSPPTVSASVVCDQWGGGGWCRSNARLAVTASDPQGYALSASGANPTFNCAGSCTVNLPAGSSIASYTATSSVSGLSATGSTSWAYDPYPPTASMIISGTSGSNGWYVSPVTVAANATDSLSGVASARVSGGGAWSPVISLSDGSYTLNVTAYDIAGNTTTGSPQNIRVDTTAPSISPSTTGALNANGWYHTSITLSASVSDATSGVNGSAQVSLDSGTTWQNTPLDLNAGVYQVQYQAFDMAGNKATSQQTFRIDTVPPSIAIASEGTEGSGGWFISPVTLIATASDDLSGVAYAQYRVNGGTWTSGSSVTLKDGVYTVDFQVFDLAGHVTKDQRSVQIDTVAPSDTVTTSGTEGSAGWYIWPATLTITASDNLSGVASSQYRINGGEWTEGSSVMLSDGISTVDFLVRDTASNSATVSRTIRVDTVPPVLTHSIAGTIGNSPWYTSSITITAAPSDSTSGIEATEYRVNGGEWEAGQVVTVNDGIHAIDLRTRDHAGNLTQYNIAAAIDSTPPISRISSPEDGATVAKTVVLIGVLSDGLSGVKSVQIKIDSSPWVEVDQWSEISWEYRWETGYSMNGQHAIRLLVTDNAGNTAEDSITLSVENSRPIIFGPIQIYTSTPLPSPTSTFIPTVIPTVALPKPPAEAFVALSPTPTFLPAVSPTGPLSEPPAEVHAIPSQASTPLIIATQTPTIQPQKKIVVKALVSSWRLYTIAAGLFAVFGLTFVLDRRPAAYRKTAKILRSIMQNNSKQE